MNELIRLENISKSFGDNHILEGLSLSINKNEFVTILGPSGCGKTTLLRIIGGFEMPDSGRVFFDGKDITNISANERHVNTVFQNYALFPHMNVGDNVAFGLRVLGLSEDEIGERVDEALSMVKLSGYEKRTIDKLSGGQQQRVAMARAIVNRPRVLLLDEPLAALDLKLRQEMQYELVRIKNELGITFLFITHDQEEALTMSDTVVVMNDGVIQQMGSPESIYNEPINAFVADFIGDSNILDGIMRDDRVIEIGGTIFECVDTGFAKDEPVDVMIRPEDIEIRPYGKGNLNAVITSSLFIGMHYEMLAESELNTGFEWLIQNYNSYEVGSKVGMYVKPENIQIMHKPKTEDEKALDIEIY